MQMFSSLKIRTMMIEEWIKKVSCYGRKHELWQVGDRILVAVSGGPDSLALLLTLSILAEREGIVVGCCTVNHHLRDCAEDEVRFVEGVCKERKIPFFRKDIDVRGAMKFGGSLETVARKLRYEAIREVMKTGGYQRMAVAHHGDDQAETVLYHLIKGSGVTGLSGIKPKNGDIIRPFLLFRKQEIENFLKAFPYMPCHDETNDIPNTERNRIRLKLLPELRTYNSAVTESLMRTADILREEDVFMSQAANKFLKCYAVMENGSCTLERESFVHELPAMQRRVLRHIFSYVCGKSPSYEAVERSIFLITEGKTGQITSASGCAVILCYDSIYFCKGSTREGKHNYTKLINFKHHHNTKTDIIHNMFSQDGRWMLIQEIREISPDRIAKNQLLLDADKVNNLTLRYWQEGDRFSGKGISGSKKLNRVMQDLHIPAEQRRQWPLIADEKHIYWIAFLRVSRFALPNEHTKKYLLLTLKKEHTNHNEKSGARY